MYIDAIDTESHLAFGGWSLEALPSDRWALRRCDCPLAYLLSASGLSKGVLHTVELGSWQNKVN